jgi:hypothetical protein
LQPTALAISVAPIPLERERGGYPRGFHQWPIERRNSWYSGFSFGLLERQRALLELAHE